MEENQLLPLAIFRKNYHSQGGEDGVIEELFKRLNITSGTLVEFGAWDGIFLSNTYHHYKKPENNFHLVLIEGDESRFYTLKDGLGKETRVMPMHAFVSQDPASVSSLTNLLARANVNNEEFQLLSIDVDGLDFEIWKALDKTRFKPKIVIIEFNDWREDKARQELYDTFTKDGYVLAYCTGNFIFIRADLGLTLPEKTNDQIWLESNTPDLLLFLEKIDRVEFHRRWEKPIVWEPAVF
jgi:hypothetical protein